MKKFLTSISILGLLASAVPAYAGHGGAKGYVTPSITIQDVQVDEGGKNAVLTVQKSGRTRQSSAFTYKTETLSGDTATSGIDYTPRNGSITMAATQTTSQITIPILEDTQYEGNETFHVSLGATTNVVLTDGSAVVTILDNDVNNSPTTKSCPDGSIIAINLTCPSAPADPGTTGGASGVSDNFDITTSYQTASIPGTAAPDVVGAFRFICGAGQVLADDPVVFPNNPGASHLHQFYGNLAATGNTDTYAEMRAAGGSTCNYYPLAGPATTAANRSGYWMPAMEDGAGNVVRPDFVSIYYKRRPLSDPKCSFTSGDPKAIGNCVPTPNGIKYIFGFDVLTGTVPTGGFHFNCQGPTAVGGTYHKWSEVLANCPINPPTMKQNQVGLIIDSPECWDGVNLDSSNHRSHVADASYGSWGYLKCPADHPFVIPKFTLGAWYTVDANLPNWHLSSDAMAPTVGQNLTFHADYFESWSPTVKAFWVNTGSTGCINAMLNCSAGNTGDGHQLKGADSGTAAAIAAKIPRLIPISSVPYHPPL